MPPMDDPIVKVQTYKNVVLPAVSERANPQIYRVAVARGACNNGYYFSIHTSWSEECLFAFSSCDVQFGRSVYFYHGKTSKGTCVNICWKFREIKWSSGCCRIWTAKDFLMGFSWASWELIRKQPNWRKLSGFWCWNGNFLEYNSFSQSDGVFLVLFYWGNQCLECYI